LTTLFAFKCDPRYERITGPTGSAICASCSKARLGRRPKTTESEPPPVMQSSIKSADAHGGRKHDACFSSMPVPTVGSSATRRADQFTVS
jgi:hypothetical protein